jgi:glutamine cyclotransferase
MRRYVIWLAALFGVAGICVVWVLARDGVPPTQGYRVVHVYPHDPDAYTQGLIFTDGHLYESTGKYGESSLRKVELQTGRVVQSRALARDLFAEGITAWENRIVQLTWKNQLGIVYDKESLREVQRFRYSGEGWGLTHDGTHLIVSDGSATLRFLDPQTFRLARRLLVKSRGRRVGNLNELEYVRGEILANVWYQDYIARISPRTGEVVGWIDLSRLLPERRDTEAVLNGIAHDAEGNRLFVTGKNWPKLFEIELTSRGNAKSPL